MFQTATAAITAVQRRGTVRTGVAAEPTGNNRRAKRSIHDAAAAAAAAAVLRVPVDFRLRQAAQQVAREVTNPAARWTTTGPAKYWSRACPRTVAESPPPTRTAAVPSASQPKVSPPRRAWRLPRRSSMSFQLALPLTRPRHPSCRRQGDGRSRRSCVS